MTRRNFLAAATAAMAGAAPASRPLLFVTEAEIRRMRDFIRTDRAALIGRNAATAMRAGPWSVTFHRPAPGLKVNAGPNDYVSQAPYWWPDPKNPSGPYIRRDGEHNPDRFTGHRRQIDEVCSAVLALAMSSFFLNQDACSRRAAEILSVWFLDPKTRMNPNLEHGEMIVGVNTGRGSGIIATQVLLQAAQGIVLMEAAGPFDAAVAKGVRAWCQDYLKWLTTSRHGLSERTTGNNHSTWWTVQVATLAAFTGDTSTEQVAWEHCRGFLIPHEIRPDGHCPREEERTRSLHYSSMNLDAFSLLCRLAQMDGADLWNFRTPQGVGVENAFDYLAPFLARPETWPDKQITEFTPGIYYFPGLAALALRSKTLRAIYDRLPRAESPWVQFQDILIRSA
jgi:hypothetical protein